MTCQRTSRPLRRLWPAPILLALLAALAGIAPAWAQCVELPGCVLVWADEFDGTELDLTRWTPQLGDGTAFGLPAGWGNNELQYYRAENATVAGGLLTITAREESFAGRDYTSARLRSLAKGDWTYGRMEMRARMPLGQGLWPAFWMLPSDSSIYGTWAASGEIDIVEYLGNQPRRIFGTLHYGGAFPDNVFTGTNFSLPLGSTFHDGFHVFAVEWEFGEIRWYVDEVHYATQTDWYSTGGPFPAPFDVDFHLLLNLAVGGNLPGDPDASTEFPQEYVIDYVRVYQLPNAPAQVTITSPGAGDSPVAGEDLTISVDAVDDGTVELVQFYQDRALLGQDLLPPFQLTVPRVAAGCYTLRARARDDGGVWSSSEPLAITVAAASGEGAGGGCPQAPYLMSPVAIPGIIQAEDYDLGGPGVAYNDSDAGNNGGSYRPDESVDLEGTSDPGYGFNVGWTAPGEWLEYATDVEPGTYDIEMRVASNAAGGTLHLEFDGVDRTGPVSFGGTGGWQDWITVRVPDVTLDAGLQTMRLALDTGGFNINRIAIGVPDPSEQSSTCTTTASPCQRSGNCSVQGSNWFQEVTADRFDIYDDQTWPALCDSVHQALQRGECDPAGGDTDVTAYLGATSFATIPSITGPLVCAAPPAAVGAVPDGAVVPGVPLALRAEPDGNLVLDWGASCLSAGNDYVVYEGVLGQFTSHAPATCSTAGATSWTLTPAAGNRYYLVTPSDGTSEGSHGRDGDGAERPTGAATCLPVNAGTCPP